jgi:hypothetical protein
MKNLILIVFLLLCVITVKAQAPVIICNWDGADMSAMYQKNAIGEKHYKGVMITGRFDTGTSEGFRTLSIAFPLQAGTFNLASGSKETEVNVNSSQIAFSSKSEIAINGTVTVESADQSQRRVAGKFSFSVQYNGSRKTFRGVFKDVMY